MNTRYPIYVFALILVTGQAMAEYSPRASIGEDVYPDEGHVLQPDQMEFQRSIDEPIFPQHPPIDEIPPMPNRYEEGTERRIGLPDEGVVSDHPDGEGVDADPQRHSGPESGQADDSFAGINPDSWDEMDFSRDDGFGTMTEISDDNLESSPWRRNAKLVMRFEDEDDIDRFFVCSATVQDAGMAFTAAHCLYAHEPGDLVINDWAKEVWIYPGWDGDGSVFGGPNDNEHIEKWGWAHSPGGFGNFTVGTSWFEDGDWAGDFGFIRFQRTQTRQVGMVSGWFGRAWGRDCDWITDNFYHNASYPAENCPDAGMHTGRDMYYWGGSYEWCANDDRTLRFDTGDEECLTSQWGGMSGSGSYYRDDGSRFVHAVASHSGTGWAGHAKLWGGMNDSYVETRDGNRGETADFEALKFRSGDGHTAVPGHLFGPSTVQIGNPTNADPAEQTFTLRIYLSSNNNITENDTLLATFNYTVDFSPMELRNWNVPEVYIPLATPPGTYWIGAVLDSDADGNPSNNNVWGWDAQEIRVVPETILHDRFEQ